MPLRRMAEFNRQDFIYESPDGDEWRITFFDTSDRKYIEIQKQGEEKIDTWDMDMFLDIADAVRKAVLKQTVTKKSKLKGPSIVDHRADLDQVDPESIQSSVDKAMEQVDLGIRPVESFSPGTPEQIKEDIEGRKLAAMQPLDPEKKIRRTSKVVKASDLM